MGEKLKDLSLLGEKLQEKKQQEIEEIISDKIFPKEVVDEYIEEEADEDDPRFNVLDSIADELMKILPEKMVEKGFDLVSFMTDFLKDYPDLQQAFLAHNRIEKNEKINESKPAELGTEEKKESEGVPEMTEEEFLEKYTVGETYYHKNPEKEGVWFKILKYKSTDDGKIESIDVEYSLPKGEKGNTVYSVGEVLNNYPLAVYETAQMRDERINQENDEKVSFAETLEHYRDLIGKRLYNVQGDWIEILPEGHDYKNKRIKIEGSAKGKSSRFEVKEVSNLLSFYKFEKNPKTYEEEFKKLFPEIKLKDILYATDGSGKSIRIQSYDVNTGKVIISNENGKKVAYDVDQFKTEILTLYSKDKLKNTDILKDSSFQGIYQIILNRWLDKQNKKLGALTDAERNMARLVAWKIYEKQAPEQAEKYGEPGNKIEDVEIDPILSQLMDDYFKEGSENGKKQKETPQPEVDLKKEFPKERYYFINNDGAVESFEILLYNKDSKAVRIKKSSGEEEDVAIDDLKNKVKEVLDDRRINELMEEEQDLYLEYAQKYWDSLKVEADWEGYDEDLQKKELIKMTREFVLKAIDRFTKFIHTQEDKEKIAKEIILNLN